MAPPGVGMALPATAAPRFSAGAPGTPPPFGAAPMPVGAPAAPAANGEFGAFGGAAPAAAPNGFGAAGAAPAAAPAGGGDPFDDAFAGLEVAEADPATVRYEKREEATYVRGGAEEAVTIVGVHYDSGDPPYYTVRMRNGAERQTDALHLRKLAPGGLGGGAGAPAPGGYGGAQPAASGLSLIHI